MNKHKYWITFRFFIDGGNGTKQVEGDLVAETEKLDVPFFKSVKSSIVSAAVQANHNVLVPGMSEPTIQACILLDD
jgi:hypothetical protein